MYNINMSNYILYKRKNPKGIYIALGISKGYGKGIGNLVGLGYWEEIKEKYSLQNIDDLKPIARLVPVGEDKIEVKTKFFQLLNPTSVETNVKNVGIELIYKVIKELDLFKGLPKTKHKSLEEVLEFIVATRIIQPRSYICQYKNKNDFLHKIDVKKSSIYNYFDTFLEYKNTILVNIYNKMQELTTRNTKLIHFDNTTVYFQSFSRDGLRKRGFSKDGKHDEDQIVVAMAVDNNGIPFHYKVFEGNTGDSKTLVKFLIEMQRIYKTKDTIIVADKGISQNANLRYLEQKGYKYIVQKRIDILGKEDKAFIVNDQGFVQENDYFTKSRFVQSIWAKNKNKKRYSDTFRKQFVYFSPSKQTLDKIKRQNLINKLEKKSINGELPLSALVPEYKKKYMDVDGKTVGRLNIEKIKKVANEDGFYMIETNITNIDSKEANEIYKGQWKVEEGFRTLKSAIEVRPMYVYKDEHIQSHVFLCFLSLIVLKYCIYKLKKFYKDNGEIQKLTMNMFIDALKLITITTKTVNGKVVSEIKNNLDPEHKELNKIYSDFQYVVDGLSL
ncbi:transposase domain-containing protein (plasmid) [Mycoplasmopsis gallopavonis]|uniref:Transposase domain-containing protein n=3 Tax=Mycoplasmoidales TaxID=2790996 RepID=A0A449AZZ7_9BACT|nr:transposase domain-containing protein [Mycoplasmopsis gallopavonis]